MSTSAGIDETVIRTGGPASEMTLRDRVMLEVIRSNKHWLFSRETSGLDSIASAEKLWELTDAIMELRRL